MDANSLLLHHELLLLALHDEKGTIAFGQMIEYGLGGALFTELVLEGRANVVEDGGRRRKQFVELSDMASTRDVALDAALQRLALAKRRATPRDAVTRIAGIRGLRNLVATDLARRGILQESEQQVLLLFRRRVYPLLDPQPERAVIARLRKALEGTGVVDARTAALIGLADATSSLSAMYKRAELKALRPRIKAIREADVGSRAAREAIEAVTMVIMAAAAAAAVGASG